MTDIAISITVDERHMAKVREMAALGAGRKAEQALQQTINREGQRVRRMIVRHVEQIAPGMKRDYIDRRVLWRPQGPKQVGRLRLYGRGRGGGRMLRPRHMQPEYVTTAPARLEIPRRQRTGGVRAEQQAAPSYGFAGSSDPRLMLRTVDQGFVLAVDKGPSFVAPWQPGFAALRQAGKVQVFRREGPTRRPVAIEEGTSVGDLIGRDAAGVYRDQLGDRVTEEYARRIDRELAAIQRGAT